MPKSSSKTSAGGTPKSPKKIRKTGVAKDTSPTTKKLPGYWRFSREVLKTLWTYRLLFVRIGLLAWVALMTVSLTSEFDQYVSLSDATREVVAGLSDGAVRVFVATGVLFFAVLSGSLLSVLSEQQHLYRLVVFVFLWLAAVWMLRHLLAGTAVKVRDGLYNATAPLISSVLVLLVGVVQLLPLALALSLSAALLNTGALDQWAVAIVLGVVVTALLVLTLYWLVGTLFAAIIVTIPGTYPFAALRSARALAAGYRAALLLRIMWLGMLLLLAYTIVMTPFFYADVALGISNPALIVSVFHLLSVASLLYASGYVYLLYRKMIDGRPE